MSFPRTHLSRLTFTSDSSALFQNTEKESVNFHRRALAKKRAKSSTMSFKYSTEFSLIVARFALQHPRAYSFLLHSINDTQEVLYSLPFYVFLCLLSRKR